MTAFFSRLSGTGPGDEPVDLGQVQSDDALIESLRSAAAWDNGDTGRFGAVAADTTGVQAVGSDLFPLPTEAVDPADLRLAQLLQDWRREIDSVPMPPPIDPELATRIIRSIPQQRRAVRPAIAVAAAIAGLLVGSAAIGARSATPDTLLWPVTQLLWGDRADSVEAGIEAREGIDRASAALDAGHPIDADVAIDHVTEIITRVDARDGRQVLESDIEQVQLELESMTSTMPPPIPQGTAVTTSPVPDPPTTFVAPAPAPAQAPGGSVPQILSSMEPTPEDVPSAEPTPSEPITTDPVEPTGGQSTTEDPGSSTEETTEPSPSDPSADPTGTTASDPSEGTVGGGAIAESVTEQTDVSPADPPVGGSPSPEA